MASLIQRLDNNELVLLMYLAGELPAEDRAEVERMLASDASLAAEFEVLRAAWERTHDALQRLDSAEHDPKSDAAIRQVLRAMRQWQLGRASTPAPSAQAPQHPRAWWWAYPSAAAAAILLGLLIWWSISPPSALTISSSAPANSSVDSEVLTALAEVWVSPAQADATSTLAPLEAGTDELSEESSQGPGLWLENNE